MNPLNNALVKKIGKGAAKAASVPKKAVSKIGAYLDKNKKLNDAAGKEMDKRYPAGWSQSATNMNEFGQIRKGLKKIK